MLWELKFSVENYISGFHEVVFNNAIFLYSIATGNSNELSSLGFTKVVLIVSSIVFLVLEGLNALNVGRVGEMECRVEGICDGKGQVVLV